MRRACPAGDVAAVAARTVVINADDDYAAAADAVVQLVPDQHRRGLCRNDVRIAPADQRRQTDDEAQHPYDHHQHFGPEASHQTRILDRTRDGQVPVQRDCAQVQYAGSAHPHVNGQPHGTQIISK